MNRPITLEVVVKRGEENEEWITIDNIESKIDREDIVISEGHKLGESI